MNTDDIESHEAAARHAVLAKTLEAYQTLRSQDRTGHWPLLSAVAVKCERIAVHSDAKAWQRSLELYDEVGEQRFGWVRHRSVAYRVGDNSDAETKALGKAPEAGPPIAGEWALPIDPANPGVSVSIHLRPDDNEPGKLAEWKYEARPFTASDTLRHGELAALRQDVAVLTHPWNPRPIDGREVPDEQPILIYHVYWGSAAGEDPYALRRLCSRLVGFADVKEFPKGEPIVVRPGNPR